MAWVPYVSNFSSCIVRYTLFIFYKRQIRHSGSICSAIGAPISLINSLGTLTWQLPNTIRLMIRMFLQISGSDWAIVHDSYSNFCKATDPSWFSPASRDIFNIVANLMRARMITKKRACSIDEQGLSRLDVDKRYIQLMTISIANFASRSMPYSSISEPKTKLFDVFEDNFNIGLRVLRMSGRSCSFFKVFADTFSTYHCLLLCNEKKDWYVKLY